MKNFVIAIIFALLAPCDLLAQMLGPGKWYDFDGKIGEADAQLSIFLVTPTELKGNYCYKKVESKFILKGMISGDSLTVSEVVAGQENGLFKGRFISTDEGDQFEGIWTDKKRTKRADFKFKLSSMVSGSVAKRYENMIGSDAAVEGFVKRLKSSLNRDNREWIAAHIQYPLKTRDNSGKNMIIKTESQFVKDFDKVFYPEFKEQIKQLCSCNMFANYEGVMLGRGQIWIANSPESTEKKFDFAIIAINN